ncbi:MAG TPA: hypothetical protein VFF73_38070 [Planctomycetota bacterium]|nr:hypothetical protein [Planctomycetota bacterium]
MANPTEGVTLTYQGKLCSALPFEYSRPSGLEPGKGFLHMLKDELQDFSLHESLQGVDTVDPPHTVSAPTPGLTSSGELVFTEVVNGVAYAVTIEQVLITERAIEVAIATDDDNSVCRIELTDIRYLWATRGAPVFGWINVPRRQGANAPAPTIPTTTVKPPAPAAGAPAANPEFIAGSMRQGAPWTLRQVLEEKILPNLPGSPKLLRLPPARETAQPKGHVWNGVLPKVALAQVLDEFQLVLTLNIDGSVSVWERNEGELQDPTGQLITYDPANPNVDDRVATARALVAYKHVPACVMVVGGRVVKTERQALEAVGEISGAIAPLSDALAAIGLTVDQARQAALLPHEKRAALLLIPAPALREFERWAFKWFRLQGGAEKNADKLPLLPGRGVVDSVGQWLPHRVFSEGHTTFSVMEAMLAKLDSSGLGSAPTKVQDKVFNAIQQNVAHYKVVVNLPFDEQAAGFRIDRQRGLVKFENVQGTVAQEGASLDEASLASALPHVELEFGYEKRPGFDNDVTSDLRYSSVWVRTTVNGKTSVQQAQGLAPGVAPVLKQRPDLELVFDVNGNSNQALLDASAQKTAEDVFQIEQSSQGSVVSFCRPVPVVTTGKVLTVTWSLDNELPRTVAHIGVYAPLAPEPRSDLRTRAFGELDGRVRGSVIAPGGVS